jgi:hypothetical protein
VAGTSRWSPKPPRVRQQQPQSLALNTDDGDARAIIDEIRRDRNWLKKQRALRGCFGMAPPECKNAYKDSFDESMRRK